MQAPSPRSEQELIENAQQISGLTIGQLAERFGLPVPENLLHNKGWVGQLLERALGATATSKPEPDFEWIGVELKTLPINAQGKPKESTFVCSIDLIAEPSYRWETSTVYKKLKRVLWLPIEADQSIPITQRRIGQAILWSPCSSQEQQLRADWEELTDMLSLGELEQITAHYGEYLQIRPKAAHGKSLTWGIGESGERILTLPRGFYLRTRFTKQILP